MHLPQAHHVVRQVESVILGGCRDSELMTVMVLHIHVPCHRRLFLLQSYRIFEHHKLKCRIITFRS